MLVPHFCPTVFAFDMGGNEGPPFWEALAVR